ncbi:MAG: PilZ domain-containing protein [Nitrospiraceae bacterium]|nr:MAG: PilZ domain-containing protein [Nitrospiraceae bacterium]
MSMQDERRRHIRFEVPLDVTFRPLNDQAPYSAGVIRNFSRSGCCIESGDPETSLKEILELKVRHPQKDMFVNATGDIVWKRPVGGGWLAGVRILEMDKAAKSEILDFAYDIWLEKNLKLSQA